MARPVDLPKSSRFVVLAAMCVVVAALYFAQDVLIPLALALLVSFLLTPVVNQLERWRLGRIGSVLVVVIVGLGLLVGLGYVVTGQVLNLATNLDKYTDNIVEKLRAMQPGKGGVIEDVTNTYENVQQKLDKPATTQTTQPSDVIVDEIATRTDTPRAKSEDDLANPTPAPAAATQPLSPAARAVTEAVAAIGGPWTKENPFPTAVIQPRPSATERLGAYAGVVLGPVGTAGLVVVFVIFMLLQREDLRDRMIRLVGGGQLNVTTQALDDAASRISRYLLAQAIVNGSYGVAISIGLWIIGRVFGEGQGFPNFILWGLLCAVLRFIPYIGPWIAAIFPIAVSFATFHGFGAFFATAGMFVVIELLSNNVMEPWLYGTSTGMSTVAVLVSAVFWTWLWGAVGLLLATPLTVVLVVIGKYVPQLRFLDILLGDEPVLEPPQRVYQRLLALDQEEATDISRGFLKEWSSLERVYDDVLLPALALAEQDRHKGRLDEERAQFVRQSMREMVEELGEEVEQAGARHEEEALSETIRSAAAETVAAAKTLATKIGHAIEGEGEGNGAAAGAARPRGPGERAIVPKNCVVNVVCLPAHDEADEIVSLMFAQLLAMHGYCTFAQSVTKLASEMVDAVEQHKAHAVVVSALPPGAVSYSRYLCKRLHARFPDVNMLVGLWTMRGDLQKARDRVTCIGTVRMATTLGKALDEVAQLVQPAIVAAGATDPDAMASKAADAADAATAADATAVTATRAATGAHATADAAAAAADAANRPR